MSVQLCIICASVGQEFAIQRQFIPKRLSANAAKGLVKQYETMTSCVKSITTSVKPMTTSLKR